MTETNSTTWMELTGLCDGRSQWWERPWERTSVMTPVYILYKNAVTLCSCRVSSWFLQDVLSGWNTRFRYHLLFEQPSTICGGSWNIMLTDVLFIWLFDFNCTLWPDICSKTSNFFMIQAQDIPHWHYS